ncbi:MAG: hypothetical protein IIX85_08075 [Clostridia bacterium]|nr:hypothetical protein [Clostridia bacterium]MBQ2272946.1 hypothetical protein [Clostridia bacterium]MBQ5820872.1 hypothetical protein [Clostridia bacterium]
MEERRLSTGASCFLIKDDGLKEVSHSYIACWLRKNGFTCEKGVMARGVPWVYINIYSKVYAPGRAGIEYTKVVGDHAITFPEFLTIYNIFKKYEGFSTLKMTEEEQKEFEAYCKRIEEKYSTEKNGE